MTFTPIFKNEALDQEAIDAAAMAFSIARNDLGLRRRPHPLTEVLANQIITAVQTGERNPKRLAKMATDALAADIKVAATLARCRARRSVSADHASTADQTPEYRTA